MVYLIFNGGCGLVCAFLARSKGRSPFWWSLGGLVFTLLAVVAVSFASDRSKMTAMELELQALRREVSDLRFDAAVTVGSAGRSSICPGCRHVSEHYSVCTAFGRDLDVPVVACSRFVAGNGEADADTEDRGGAPEGPAMPPSPVRF